MASLDSSPKITIGKEAPNPKIAIMIATLIKSDPWLAIVTAAPKVGPTQGLQINPSKRPITNAAYA